MEEDRKKHTRLIVESSKQYRIVAAGPGTGKSFTMLQILKSKPGRKYVVLTLTNELINELDKDLGQHANCKTFHSLCLDIFRDECKAKEILSPHLQEIIEYDAKILKLGHNLSTGVKDFLINSNVESYLTRASYYGAVCFDLLVYKVVSFLAQNISQIRKYDLVLIDEFQDFNKVETELVNLLEHSNNIIIVGDDDQSIYSFRNASPKFFRDKVANGKYEKFTLPYCSRCTQVIIDTVNQIAFKAKEKNIFIDRIDKEYKCYLPDKQIDSENYPRILHKNFSVQSLKCNYMGNFIEIFYKNIDPSEIQKAQDDKKTIILIIGPTHYLNQIFNKLKASIDPKLISFKRKEKQDLFLIDGLKLINDDTNSNLGWRIIAKSRLKKNELDPVIKNSVSDKVHNHISSEVKSSCHKIIDILKNPVPSKEEKQYALDFTRLDSYERVMSYWKRPLTKEINEHEGNSLIKLTTFEGAKGLAADYVFIVGVGQGVLPKKKQPTETDVCKLIVALTRTRKLCYICTCLYFEGKPIVKSGLVDWIPKKNIEYEYIEKNKMDLLYQNNEPKN